MTSKVPLLPSMNRNLSHNLDVHESGLVAYGCRSSIYIFNFRTSIPLIVDTKLIPNAHRGKVVSVSFCKSGNELIASIGEDNVVRIWDLQTDTCIASQEAREGTRVVEWLHGSASSVTFPGASSLLSKWNFTKNKLVHMKTGSDSFVHVLSSNKKSPELLAAGHAVGTISILNMDTQILVHKLKGHVMVVTSLRWSPVTPTMLLSTSSDQTARVWKLGESKPVRTYSYPRARKMEDKKYPVKLCGIFHPENPDIIICSNVRGCLGEITFKESDPPKFSPYDEKNCETGFRNVITMIPYITENNKTLLITSDYLKIALWDISERKLLSSFSYLNGNVYDLSPSLINPYMLAISSGDGCLRVWNLNEPSKLEMTTIVVYTRIKIMSVAWHPTAESIIAYGSDEGRVGIADILKKRSLYCFETHHSNAVYAMQWAPCPKIKETEEDFFLYSCGGGVIYIHERNKPKEKPADFDDLITFPPDIEFIQKTHSELSWKHDYSCLIIGSFKGFLDLYDDNLNFLTRVTMQMKIVESIKWHPNYTFTSSKGSNYSSWFAAAGNDDNIQVFDTSDIKGCENESILCRPTKTLVGHKKKISSLCWSPHTDCYMASASRDGTVLVWNVLAATIIANYAWHKDIVYAVHWSVSDPDTIYSGGMDCCLRVWKISEQTDSSAPEKSQVIRRKTKLLKPKEHNSRDSQSVDENLPYRELNGSNNSINESLKDLETPTTEENSVEDSSGKRYFKNKIEYKEYKKKIFSGYMSISKEKKLENILKLTDLLSQPPNSSDPDNMTLISDQVTDEDSLHCGLYCDQLTAVKMLETKAKAEKIAGNNEKLSHLQLMANNVEPLLIDSAENKKLTDFLMAAAITVSRQFYNEMCKKYAVQLIEEKNYMKASMYLLFCGELHNAVKTLLEKEKILEALALAKAQLPEDDPFVRGALHKASNYFSAYHQHENEAECYLALKEPSEAAKTLYRIADSSSIYVSVYICKKFNLIEEAESYGYLCMEKCLAEAAWPTFYKLIDLMDSFKVYKLLIRVHELIFLQIKTLKKDGIAANELFGVTGNKLQIWQSKSFGDFNISFLPFVYDVLKSENIVPEDKESLEEICNALDAMIAKRQKYEKSEEAHINLAIFTSQVIVSSLLNDFCTLQKYFYKVFPAAYNVVFLPRVVFWLFMPFDIHWCCNKDTFICENKYLESQSSSFLHLQSLYKSICDKFTSSNLSCVEDFSISQAFSSTLSEAFSSTLSKAVEQVLSALSKKTSEDSFILYFSICYITELRRLAKNGWKFRCYNNLTSDDKKTEGVVPEDKNLSVACDKYTACDDNKDSKKGEVKTEVNCSKNTTQNNLASLETEVVTMQNKVINHFSSEDKDNILLKNASTSLLEENNLTSLPSLVTAEDNVQNAENANALSSTMFSKIRNFLIPIYNNDGPVTEEDLSVNVNNEVEKEILSKKTEISSLDKVDNGISSLEKIDNEVSSLEKVDNEASSSTKKTESEMSSLEKIDNDVSSLEKIDNDVSSLVKTDNDVSSLVKTDNEIISAKENNDKDEEKETILESTSNKTEANANTSPEYIYKTSEVKEISSETDDDHLQCWSDISLYYTLTKCFSSINCRDEYALFFYLQKYLHYMDSTIADAVRQQSAKNNPKELPCVTEEKVILNENKNCSDLIEVDKDCQENSNISSSLKSVETTDSPKVDNSSCKYDSFMLEKEIKNEVDENQIKISLVSIANGETELTDEANIKTPNQESENSVDSDLHEEIDLAQEHMIPEDLHSEHEKVSQLVRCLSTVEFDYPNPFDAVSAINGICCDIFRKNPCNFVKKKFHEFAHSVNKWNAKFCIKGETVKCDICKETIDV